MTAPDTNRYADDPLAELLRRAANGDRDAAVAFHAERNHRAACLRAASAEAHHHVRTRLLRNAQHRREARNAR